MVPPRALAVFAAEGWNLDIDPEAIRERLGSTYAPACLLARGEREEVFSKRAVAIEQTGVRVFTPHSPVFIDSSVWERLFPETAIDLARELGLRGIFQDASWSLQRRIWARENGRNPNSGFARLQEYWRSLAPELGWMAERANEVSARGCRFALDVSRLPEYAHPVTSFLLGDRTRTWNLAPDAASLDADDVRGWMTTWPSRWNPEPTGVEAMLRRRGVLFAERQLQSIWPEAWNPAALHYWRGSDGAEYRSVRDRGTRFVRISGAREETLWWRIQGVREANAPGMGIPGWVAYDGDRILGLAASSVYIPQKGVERPSAVISAIPEEVAVESCVLRDGFWCVRLKRAAGEADAEATPRTYQLSLQSDKQIGIHGAEKTVEKGGGKTEVTVAVPGGFAVSWSEPQPLAVGQDLSDRPVPVSYHDLSSGVLVRAEPAFEPGNLRHEAGALYPARASICWLVDMPLDKSVLTFQYGSGSADGDGANYYVRVNGRTIWHRYRAEKKGKGKEALKPDEAEIDMSAYVLKPIVLEFSTDGHFSGVADEAAWHSPKLKGKETTEGPGLMDDVGL